ncbi:MAG: hypothetical protein IT422_03470 [Pirellulaceae bacterium]|jgi:hypothetical protein|nr:hypothetical protein [Pirellulaceae bacterium]
MIEQKVWLRHWTVVAMALLGALVDSRLAFPQSPVPQRSSVVETNASALRAAVDQQAGETGDDQAAELYFREDWKESPAETPVTQEHVASGNLLLARHGPAGDSIKKSHHDEIANDPWYVWSGTCTSGRWAISLRKNESLVDLSRSGRVRWRTKQSGPNVLRIILELDDGSWLVSDRGFGETPAWHEFEVDLATLPWRELNIHTVEAGGIAKEPKLDRVRSIGWTDLMTGKISKGCTRVDWIEVYGRAVEPLSP